jgi:selenocysteine-specific elongation factor
MPVTQVPPTQVIATAGHVDHGKSTLVRALTGMEPDRWAQERRRRLTIDLGYAWLTLGSGARLAFVDVPGHERFVPNMLAGVGPVPAVLFVVAADGGWMPQSEEHLAAVHALGISRGLLVVTRADLADPGPALRQAAARIGRSSLGAVEAVVVSAVTGLGMPALLAALGRLVAGAPASDPAAPVRLWMDRAFSIKGSGTVVTGTLPAGTLRIHDELLVTPSQRRVRVRGLQTLMETVDSLSGVARAAVNLRGVHTGALARGMALVTPGAWTLTSVVDVRFGSAGSGPGVTATNAPGPPRELMMHVGSARTAARVRPLAGAIAQLTLAEPLPLHVGDRVLLRFPGAAPPVHVRPVRTPPAGTLAGAGPARAAWPPLLGATVLDVAPPALTRRGGARAAGNELGSWPAVPAAADLLRRHGLLRAGTLRAMGVADLPAPVTGDWLAEPGYWASLAERLVEVVAAHATREPLAPGMPIEAARAALGIPSRGLVEALVAPPLTVAAGLLRAGPGHREPVLPEPVLAAVRVLCRDLAEAPFRAPDAARLRELGLAAKAVAAAGRAGLLLRVSDQIVLAPGADVQAAALLAGLPQPFTTTQARQALGTTRRVAIPLLEYLDRAGVTRRLPDDRRQLSRS